MKLKDMRGKLVYYILEEWDALFAYGECFEFFERYDRKSKCWRPSEISYSRFLHDFNGREVDEGQARQIAGGDLPQEKYAEYCRMIGAHAACGAEKDEL